MPSEKRSVAPDALRVFLSSRMEELAPERAAVRAALENEGVLAWAFEADAGARPGSTRQTYLEELAVSDVYVGVFWKGYGAFTVDEFDAAGANELPRLVYEKTTESVDRAPKLQAFLDEAGDVERGVTIRRFATPAELGELVAHDIRRLRTDLKRIWGTNGKTYTLTPNGARFDRTATMTPIRRETQDSTDCLARPDPFIDRVDSMNRVREAIASGESMVGFSGEPEIGKTAVMRSIAHDRRWTANRFPDGVGICVPGETDLYLADLLRTLWAFFYRVADRNYMPDDVEVRRDLVGKRALSFIDDIALPPGQLEQLGELMPKSVFVVAAGGPTPDGSDPLSFVKAVPLEGFDDSEDMLELFGAVYRRPVVGPARDEVARLCIAAGGSPGRITKLANEAWGSGASLDEWVLERPASGGEPISQSLARRVTPEQLRFLLILAAFGADLAMPGGVVSRLGVEADTVRAVVGTGDVEQNADHYRLPGTVYLATSTLGDAEGLRGHIFEATVEWVGEASPEEVAANRVFIQRVLEWGAKDDRQRGVLVLARVVEEPLVLTGAWGSWGTVLDLAVAAASAEQDDDTRAWALHQRGTRARMLGDRRIARRDLRAAYLLNKKRGKTSQAALSRHNLRQGSGLFPLLRVGASATFLTVASMVVAIAAGAAVVACAISDSCGNEPVTTTEVVTTTGTTIVVAPNLVLNVEAPSEFEPQLVETTSEGSTVIVTNSGDNPLTVSKIGVEGDDALAFPLVGEAQCIREFQPNDECQFEVLFAPTERRVHSAMLLIEVDKGNDETASLTGQGIVEGFIEFERFEGEFGETSVGLPIDQPLVLRNGGDTELSHQTVVEGEAFIFVDTNCVGTLAPGEGCEVTVRFDPPNPDPYEGALITGEESSLPLTGTGTTGIAQLMQCFQPCSTLEDVGPGGFFFDFSVDLGVAVVDAGQNLMTIEVKNVGEGLLEIVSITPDAETDFRLQSDRCSSGGPMAPDETCKFDLVFAPTMLFMRTTFLNIEYGLGRGPERGFVTGTGNTPPIE